MYINGLVCFLLCRVLCSVNGLKWFCLPFQCFYYKVSFWDVKMWIWLEGPKKSKASQKLTSLDCLTSSNSKQTSNCFDFVTWPFICISVLVFIRALFIDFSRVILFHFSCRFYHRKGLSSASVLLYCCHALALPYFLSTLKCFSENLSLFHVICHLSSLPWVKFLIIPKWSGSFIFDSLSPLTYLLEMITLIESRNNHIFTSFEKLVINHGMYSYTYIKLKVFGLSSSLPFLGLAG
jgi:hypothetical protein